MAVSPSTSGTTTDNVPSPRRTCTTIAPILVPLAAVGLAITMFGAIVVYVRRGDGALLVGVPIVLALMAFFVAWGRFGGYAF